MHAGWRKKKKTAHPLENLSNVLDVTLSIAKKMAWSPSTDCWTSLWRKTELSKDAKYDAITTASAAKKAETRSKRSTAVQKALMDSVINEMLEKGATPVNLKSIRNIQVEGIFANADYIFDREKLESKYPFLENGMSLSDAIDYVFPVSRIDGVREIKKTTNQS